MSFQWGSFFSDLIQLEILELIALNMEMSCGVSGYSGFKVDGTDLHTFFTWGFIYSPPLTVCAIYSQSTIYQVVVVR